MSVDSGEIVTEVYENALDYLTGPLAAERALIITIEGEELRVKGARGLAGAPDLHSSDISLGVVRSALDSGVPVNLCEGRMDSDLLDRLSLELSGIRSVVCVPYWEASGRRGVLYADSRIDARSLGPAARDRAIRFARFMEQRLELARRGERPGTPYRERGVTPRPVARDPRVVAPKTTVPPASVPPTPVPRSPQKAAPSSGGRKLRPASLRNFFQTIATLMAAGVSLSRAVELVTRQADDPVMARATQGMGDQLHQGSSLSRAMGDSGVFTSYHVAMIALGETTGSLSRILSTLAVHEEKTQAARLKMQARLTYPLMLLAGCALFLLLAPPFLLHGQFEFLAGVGAELPAVTRGLMAVSNLLRSPAFLLAFAAAGASCGWALARMLRGGPVRQRMFRWLHRVPVLGRLLQVKATAEFARCLSIQMQAGIRVTDALPLAGAVAGDPVLEAALPQAVEAVEQGLDVWKSLAQARFFSPVLLEFLRAGEESGKLPEMLTRAADLYELELESSLESWSSVLEPIVLLVLGGAAGLMMLATMLPMLEAVKSL
ncbi:MAG: type II secretion system F family protein [Armatimonadetes bacterium]|nr:type II secretion system F family protein [Armatimonadota bacterium]